MTNGKLFERIIWIVLDSVGIGELPDAADYGDVGRNTLGHIARSRPLTLPNLVRLGLANIKPLAHLDAARAAGWLLRQRRHAFRRARTPPPATGRWPASGCPGVSGLSSTAFRSELIEEFERAIGRKTIGNKPASGTEIIKELGEEHVRTGFPIVYTSGDSVFQIAAHEDVIPIAELYRMCEIARKMLDGPNRVGRVIARPFTGTPGNFRRTERRHDYAVEPPRPMLMDVLAERNVPVFGVGKIHDIYNGRGVSELRHHEKQRRRHGQAHRRARAPARSGLIFANLVDFDMLYGHRKDVEGFARSLEEFDALLGPFLETLRPSDLADHHRRSRLRSRSGESHHGPFARICADRGLQPAVSSRRESRHRATRSPTWAKLSPKISVRRFRTAEVFSQNCLPRRSICIGRKMCNLKPGESHAIAAE